MHIFRSLVGSAITTLALAQSPLVTTFGNNNAGGVGGGIYFDITANTTVTVTGIDVNLNVASGTVGGVDVLTCPVTRVGNLPILASWTQVSTGGVTSAGPGAPSTVAIAPFVLAPGTYGMAFRGVGVSFAYTNGTGANQNYATGALALAAGEASNIAFTAPLFTPRVVNCRISYTLPPAVAEATATTYGTGCYNQFASFYENFASSASFDLSNTSMSMLPSGGGGYTVLPGFTAYVPPSVGATVLALTDDSEVPVTLTAPMPIPGGSTTSLTVCPTGFVSVATGNATLFPPAVATMLSAPQTAWWAWHDFNPAIVGSGLVKFEEIAGVAYITWDGVWDYGGTAAANASTQQFQFD